MSSIYSVEKYEVDEGLQIIEETSEKLKNLQFVENMLEYVDTEEVITDKYANELFFDFKEGKLYNITTTEYVIINYMNAIASDESKILLN